MFKERLVSGVILLIIAIFTMYMGKFWLLIPLYAISLIAYRELTKALKCAEEKKWNALEIVGLTGVTAYYVSTAVVGLWAPDKIILLLATILFTFMAQMLVYVVTFPRYRAEQVVGAFFSFIYAPIMLAFVFLTRETTVTSGLLVVWLILISSWGCDTCAYCVGVLIGKHKIFPRLSPKKSLEGCIGGVLGAALIGGIYTCLIVKNFYVEIPIICAAGAVMSMVGDLAASAIKRNNEIKDYGHLIPGHGGIMDRFDSMIVTAPMTYFLVVFLLGR